MIQVSFQIHTFYVFEIFLTSFKFWSITKWFWIFLSWLVSYLFCWLLIQKTHIALINLWVFVKLKLAIYLLSRVLWKILLICINVRIFISVILDIWKISAAFFYVIIPLAFGCHWSFQLLFQRWLVIKLYILYLLLALS